MDVTPTLVTYRSIAAQVRDLDAELARLPLQWVGPFARRNFRPGNNRYQRKFKTEDSVWLEENLALQKKLVLALHQAGDGKAIREFTGSGDYVYCSSITQDGKLVVAGGEDGVVSVWNGADAKEINTFAP